ncbi:MAG: hypothetical protein Q9163_001003 [Psora crenata]
MAQTPYRQIRAVYDESTITVYQAYCPEIAIAAVQQQKLSASPKFLPARMTWIKPSWCWMMYRSGYSYKDARQSHILALKMKHEHFRELLMHAAVTQNQSGPLSQEQREKPVRVQWDPERGPRLGVLPYRSIQIGISAKLSTKWVDEWVASIEDVTETARQMKRVVDEEPDLRREDFVARDLLPKERPYEVDEELARVLGMD